MRRIVLLGVSFASALGGCAALLSDESPADDDTLLEAGTGKHDAAAAVDASSGALGDATASSSSGGETGSSSGGMTQPGFSCARTATPSWRRAPHTPAWSRAPRR